jgi:catechol-2,3-dioxygenase
MPEESEGHIVTRPVLHHVNLKTTRLQEMIDWYATVVGMETLFQFPGGAWLSNDTANHRLALLTSPRMSDDSDKLVHTGIHHFAFEYGSIDELLEAYTRLKGHGINPHFTIDHGMTTSFYYVDPDGNSVELQVDNFGDWAESREFVRSSPEFAADPIGKLVDPEQIIAARKAGISFAELHRRGYAGEFPPAEPMDPRVPL